MNNNKNISSIKDRFFDLLTYLIETDQEYSLNTDFDMTTDECENLGNIPDGRLEQIVPKIENFIKVKEHNWR